MAFKPKITLVFKCRDIVYNQLCMWCLYGIYFKHGLGFILATHLPYSYCPVFCDVRMGESGFKIECKGTKNI